MKKIIFFFYVFSLFLQQIFAQDVEKIKITNQVSSGNRFIKIGTGETLNGVGYMNSGNNADVVGNYFDGFYFDPIYGFFQLNWSTDKKQNVHIKGGTSNCPTGYGYLLSGTAKSENVGYVYFNYDQNYQVYYCVNTKKLYGKAYSPILGEQSFSGVAFDISTQSNVTSQNLQQSNSFVNDTSIIFYINHQKQNIGKTQQLQVNKGETKYFDEGSENIFYIFKKKK